MSKGAAIVKKIVYSVFCICSFLVLMNTSSLAHNNLYQSNYFTGIDDVEIFYQYWEVNNPVATLFISHGIGEHSDRYLEMVDYFTNLGLSCYTLDHRGHGRSGGNRWNVKDFGYFIEDLHTYLQIIKPRLPDKKIFLLGHSMGGEIALQYVITYPESIDGLIVSSPSVGAYLGGMDIPTYLARGMDIALTPLVKNNVIANIPMPATQIDPSLLSHDEKNYTAYANDPMVSHEPIKLRMSAELSKGMLYLQDNAGLLKVPSLILYGTEDQVVPPNKIIKFYDKITIDDKKLIGYDGYYHEIFNEIGKISVYQDTEEWIMQRISY